MRIICDWSALMGQNMYLLRFFDTMLRKGLWSAITSSHRLENYICDSEVISLMCANFAHRTIILRTPESHKEEAQRMVEFLSQGSLPLKFVVGRDQNIEADAYISSSLRELLGVSGQRIFVGNIVSVLIFSLFFRGEKIIKNKQLYGLLTIAISLFNVVPYLILACLHLAFIRIDDSHIVLVKHFVISIPFCMFFRTLRELMHVAEEWKIYTQGFMPRISWGYVNSSNSMFVGLLYLLITLAVCIVVSIRYANSALLAMITGVLYFACFRYKFAVRVGFALVSSAIVWAVFRYVL